MKKMKTHLNSTVLVKILIIITIFINIKCKCTQCGAEVDKSKLPIGGGPGYKGTTFLPKDTVKTREDLINRLISASKGDIFLYL